MNVIQEWDEGPTRRVMVQRMNRFLERYADACSSSAKADRVRSLTVPAFAI